MAACRASTCCSSGSTARAVNAKLLAEFPAHLRAYDLLVDGDEDLRERPFAERRARLEQFIARSTSRASTSRRSCRSRLGTISPRHAEIPPPPARATMPRRSKASCSSAATRLTFPADRKARGGNGSAIRSIVDAVLMYAQRGHGKRSSYYSDYTFGVWTRGEDGDQLVPVGKAYFGFTDEELVQIDRYVRRNTVDALRPGARGRACSRTRVWCWKSPSKDCSVRRGTNRASPCVFPASAGCAGTSRRGEADRLETLERMLEKIETERGVGPAANPATSAPNPKFAHTVRQMRSRTSGSKGALE